MSRRRASSWNSLAALGPVLRCALVLRGRSKCAWCKKKLTRTTTQIDHVIPRSAGGTSTIENLVPACADCNTWRDPEAPVPQRVLNQLHQKITDELRNAGRKLATAWYPWWEIRAQRNREKQIERDRRRQQQPVEVPF